MKRADTANAASQCTERVLRGTGLTAGRVASGVLLTGFLVGALIGSDAGAATKRSSSARNGGSCSQLRAVASDGSGRRLVCVRRGKTIVWTVTAGGPATTLTALTLPGTEAPPASPTTPAPPTAAAAGPAATAAPATTQPALPALPAPPTAQRDACLSGRWTFGPDEAQPVWQTYGTAIGSLTGRLLAEPVFTGAITLTFNPNGTLSGSGAVQMKAEAIQPVGNTKYRIQIDWAPVAAAAWGIDSSFLALAGAKTSLINGTLRLDDSVVNVGTTVQPRDGRINISYRCERELLTVFVSTFVSDSIGEKLFPYTFKRG